jgi:hypothetical protein
VIISNSASPIAFIFMLAFQLLLRLPQGLKLAQQPHDQFIRWYHMWGLCTVESAKHGFNDAYCAFLVTHNVCFPQKSLSNVCDIIMILRVLRWLRECAAMKFNVAQAHTSNIRSNVVVSHYVTVSCYIAPSGTKTTSQVMQCVTWEQQWIYSALPHVFHYTM